MAHAGDDQEADEGTLVHLDGSASTAPGGGTLTYTWTAPAGLVLSDPHSAMPTFAAPMVTQDTPYTFTLVVSDGQQTSAPDAMTVTVRNLTGERHFIPVWTGNGLDHMNINVVRATLDGADPEPFITTPIPNGRPADCMSLRPLPWWNSRATRRSPRRYP